MTGKKGAPAQIASARARKGKTYEEIYGSERAVTEALNRKISNKLTGIKRIKLNRRPHHHEGLDYRKWRMAVYKRDNYICQQRQVRGGSLQAHHIKPWAQFPEDRFDLENGITLCCSCHRKIHNLKVVGCDILKVDQPSR